MAGHSSQERTTSTVLIIGEFSAVGGTRTYIEHLISFYQKRVQTLVLLVTTDSDETMAKYAELHGVTYIPLSELYGHPEPGGAPYFPFKLRSERELLEKFIESINPDVVVASVGTPGKFLGHMGSRRPSIYILHTYPGTRGKGRFATALRGFAIFSRLPRGIRFITVSNFSKNRMDRVWGLGFPKNRVRVLYNTAGPILSRSIKPASGEIVLTLGHVEFFKNPESWISIARKVLAQRPDAKFIWVGPGPLLNHCQEQVAAAGLGGKILFVGGSSDVWQYYQEASVYVQTSLVESLGISVLDSMRHGIPSVVNNIGGLPEVVIDKRTGFVESVNDEHAFAARIVSLLESAVLREAMGEAARDLYAAKFSPTSWEKSFDNLHKSWLQRWFARSTQ